MKRLHIGNTPMGARFSLPVEVASGTLAILAKRGAGKTHTAAVIVEELLRHSVQVVVIDPLDVWWGLRCNPDGNPSKLDVVIFGGDPKHSDIPLTPDSGALIAEFVISSGYSAVLSTSDLSRSGHRKFVADFANRLSELKKRDQSRSTIHIVLDEADLVAPQQMGKGGQYAVCFGAVSELALRGRARGIGITLISQRSARVNKDMLSQADTLIAMQTVGQHDRKALKEWIEHNADENKCKVFMRSLAELDVGESWVWNPVRREFIRVNIRLRHTYDSSYTPRVGAKRRKAPRLADLNLPEIEAQLAATIKEVEAKDPTKLSAEVSRLKREAEGLRRELTAAKAAPRGPDPKAIQELLTLFSGIKELAVGIHTDSLTAVERANYIEHQSSSMVSSLSSHLEKLGKLKAPSGNGSSSQRSTSAPSEAPPCDSSSIIGHPTATRTGSVKHRLLIALAQHQDIGLTRGRLAALAQTSPKSGTLNARLSDLKKEECIAVADGLFHITQAGVTAAGDYQPLPTGDALCDHWRSTMVEGSVKRKAFDVLVSRYPAWVSRTELAELSGSAHKSGTLNARISDLSKLGLIETRSGEARASADLFGE